MASYTLTYSSGVQGWPSFYSFEPEYMIGMNQFFYSFKGGNLWRHNDKGAFGSVQRNQFYGVNNESVIRSVFNDSPLEVKLFKNIILQSDSPWNTTLTPNIEPGGEIASEWYKKKEGAYFGFVRSSESKPAIGNDRQYELRSLNGLGLSSSVENPSSTNPTVKFDLGLSIGSIMSVGDFAYFSLDTDTPAYSLPRFAGKIEEINVDLVNGINEIVLDRSSGGDVISSQDAYIFYIKDPVAESHGVLGHYCEFEISFISPTPTELFAVEAEVMKSFP